MYAVFKRTSDIILSLCMILILLPLFVVVMVILKLTGENEIFYFQRRIGRNNREFDIWKFATMLKNSDSMKGGSITVRNDPRVTKFGNLLRITKVNELPQIVNVLLGTMSFVGPRPLPKSDFDDYSDDIQKRIYNVTPGITGLGSLIFRDEEKYFSSSELSPREINQNFIAPYKGSLELWYNRNISFLVDFKLLVATAFTIVLPKLDLAQSLFKNLPNRPKELI